MGTQTTFIFTEILTNSHVPMFEINRFNQRLKTKTLWTKENAALLIKINQYDNNHYSSTNLQI